MSWTAATVLTDDGEVPLRDLPVAELVSAALAVDEDSRPEYTAFLQLRGDRETFEAARSLCGSADPARRALGAYVLGELGAVALSDEGDIVVVPRDQRPFRMPAVTLLLDLAAGEPAGEPDGWPTGEPLGRPDGWPTGEPLGGRDGWPTGGPAGGPDGGTIGGTGGEVQAAIATALGHLGDPRAVEPLGAWRSHPVVHVRWTVCLALTRFASRDDDALRYLVELTADPEPMVRDWSCCGLYQAGRDTPEVRRALMVRLDDDDAVTRAEALRALALFGERRAVQPLLDALDRPPEAGDDETGEVAGLVAEALSLLADRTGDPRLLARLRPSDDD
ncbi:HEAT repeat domain-containing protein [Actinoplanes sp. L3-i22]|uniref:HEAT repeat domain-containing protein n=1 Tax=Actinoplanes sp. L3-i22 TaxID=2836373 RepID=UPI001C84DF81|nr:HEAT repeat domain-containing protein [Actinoplanes sp. L3-i22]